MPDCMRYVIKADIVPSSDFIIYLYLEVATVYPIDVKHPSKDNNMGVDMLIQSMPPCIFVGYSQL